MSGEIQGHQIVVEKAHPEYGSKGRDSLNTRHDLIASYLNVPYRVSFSGSTITINASEVQRYISDGGAQLGYGESTPVADMKLAPQPSVSHSAIGVASLNIDTGAATGAFDTATPFSPTVTSGHYIWVGVEQIGDKWFVRWGQPAASEGAAVAVSFSALATRKLFTALLQKNTLTGEWGFLSSRSKFIIFTGGGAPISGGIGGDGDDYLVTRYKMNFKDGLETEDNLNLVGSTGDFSFTDQGKFVIRYEFKELTVVTNNVTIPTDCSFTVQEGDVIVQGPNWTRIAVVNSQSDFDVDDGSVLSTGQKAVISQQLTTNDLLQMGQPSLFQFDKGHIDSLANVYHDSAPLFTRRDVAYAVTTDGTEYTNAIQNPPNTYLREVVDASIPSPGNKLFTKFFANASYDGEAVELDGTAVNTGQLDIAYDFLNNKAMAVWGHNGDIKTVIIDPNTGQTDTSVDTLTSVIAHPFSRPRIVYNYYRNEYCVTFFDETDNTLMRQLYHIDGTHKDIPLSLGACTVSDETIGNTIFSDDTYEYVSSFINTNKVYCVRHRQGGSSDTPVEIYDASLGNATLPRIENKALTEYLVTYKVDSTGIFQNNIRNDLSVISGSQLDNNAGVIDYTLHFNHVLDRYFLFYNDGSDQYAIEYDHVADSATVTQILASISTVAVKDFDATWNSDRNEYLFTIADSVGVKLYCAVFDAVDLSTPIVPLTEVFDGSPDTLQFTSVGYDWIKGQYLWHYGYNGRPWFRILRGDGSQETASGVVELYDYKLYFRLDDVGESEIHWQCAVKSNNSAPRGDAVLTVTRDWNSTGRTLIDGLPSYDTGLNQNKPIRDFFLSISGEIKAAGADYDFVAQDSKSVLLTYDLPDPITVPAVLGVQEQCSIPVGTASQLNAGGGPSPTYHVFYGLATSTQYVIWYNPEVSSTPQYNSGVENGNFATAYPGATIFEVGGFETTDLEGPVMTRWLAVVSVDANWQLDFTENVNMGLKVIDLTQNTAGDVTDGASFNVPATPMYDVVTSVQGVDEVIGYTGIVHDIVAWRHKGARDDSLLNRFILNAMVDVVVTDSTADSTFYDDIYDAIQEVPNKGTILVDKEVLLHTPLTPLGKKIKFVFTPRGKFTDNGAGTAFTVNMPCQFIGLGTLEGFTVGFDLQSGCSPTRIEVNFVSCTTPIQEANLVHKVDYNYEGSIGIVDAGSVITVHSAPGADYNNLWDAVSAAVTGNKIVVLEDQDTGGVQRTIDKNISIEFSPGVVINETTNAAAPLVLGGDSLKTRGLTLRLNHSGTVIDAITITGDRHYHEDMKVTTAGAGTVTNAYKLFSGVQGNYVSGTSYQDVGTITNPLDNSSGNSTNFYEIRFIP